MTMYELILKRHAAQVEWLQRNAPRIVMEQLHLDSDTPEKAYWRYGYAVALRDMMAWLDGQATPTHQESTSPTTDAGHEDPTRISASPTSPHTD